MPKKERDEILEEISSHIEDTSQNGQSLIERLGTPESLAAKYLEDQILKPSITQKTGSFAKGKLLFVGSITVIIVITIIALKYFISTDEFDYANEEAPELIEGNEQWSTLEWHDPITIHVDQATVSLRAC